MTDKNYYGMTPNKGIHNNDHKNVKVQERTISTDLSNHMLVRHQIMPQFCASLQMVISLSVKG